MFLLRFPAGTGLISGRGFRVRVVARITSRARRINVRGIEAMILTTTNRHEASLFRTELDRSARGDQPRNNLVGVLRDLHRLLEDYAPRWYTYEHHRKSEIAFGPQGQRQAEAFLMLYNLLEEHAPRWYASELHRKARSAAERLEKLAGRPHRRSSKPTAYP